MRWNVSLLFLLFTLSASAQGGHSITLLFEHDQPALSATEAARLSALLSTHKASQLLRVQVEGHTDATGSTAYNAALAKRRASGVAALLVDHLGQQTPMEIISFGEAQPQHTGEESGKNRRVRVTIYPAAAWDADASNPSQKPAIELEKVYWDVEEQTFSVDLDDTVRVQGREGTAITIPPGALQHKDGRAMTGRAELRLREYYKAGDILLAGLHTQAPEGLLSTGGMFQAWVVKGPDTARTELRKEAEIRIPAPDKGPGADMSVFTAPASSDSLRWNLTPRTWNYSHAYWNYPLGPRFSQGEVTSHWHHRFNAWRKGFGMQETVRRPWIVLFGRRSDRQFKKATYSFFKRDLVTVEVRAQHNYRRSGRKAYGKSTLDTAFTVKRRTAEWKTTVFDLPLINCDRFWRRSDTTEFFVSTPGFHGVNLLVYFPRESAFMSIPGFGEFSVKGIPIGEPAVLIAFGKAGNDFYVGRMEYTVRRQDRVTLQLEAGKPEFVLKKVGRAIQGGQP